MIKVLGEDLGEQERGHVGAGDPGDRQGFSRLIALDVEDTVVVHGDEADAFFPGHGVVAGQVRDGLPVLVRDAAALGDGDGPVAASLEALDDTAGEANVGRPAVDAVIAAKFVGILDAVEAAEVGLEEHRRLRRALRNDGLADALAKLERRVALEDGDRRGVALEPLDVTLA